MTTALSEFKKGIYPINKIAVLYAVSKSILHNRISGTKPGPSPYLDCTEEQELADHLITIAKISYGKTRKEVKMISANVAKEKRYYKQLAFLMDSGKAFYIETKICLFIVQIPLFTLEWIPLTRNQ